MKTIEAYQSADGEIFTIEEMAKARDLDLIGEELDGLIFHILKLDASKHSAMKGIISAINSKKDLRKAVKRLDYLLSHGEE